MQASFHQRLYGFKLTSAWGRKIIFIFILVCFLLYYFIPYFYYHVLSRFSYGNNVQSCMKRHLEKASIDHAKYDAIVTHFPPTDLENEEFQVPFIGNGKLGAIADYEKPSFYVFYDKIGKDEDGKLKTEEELLRLPLNLMVTPKPLFSKSGSGSNKEQSTVLNYRYGIVEHLSCFLVKGYSGGCLFVNHTIVAHRSRPNVFLQHIKAQIEGKRTSNLVEDVDLSHENWDSSSTFTLVKTRKKNYKLYSTNMKVQEKFMAVVVAQTEIPSVLRVMDGASHHDVLSVVMHSDLLLSRTKASEEVLGLVGKVTKYTDNLLKVSIDVLLQEHKDAWNDILHTGLSITPSTSVEPVIPHPWAVNSTLYSVLSTMDSKLHDKDIPEKERYDLMKRLQTPDFCYNDNPTAHAKTLWQRATSVENIAHLRKIWSLTLRKSGCGNLISEGAEGMLQAMVLSFGRVQFTKYDLQVHGDSDILHNKISFRGIVYKNNSLDISIHDDDGTSKIQVSLKKSSSVGLYACEAGCKAPYVQITRQSQLFPVYITYPRTPILYISDDRKHLEELKHTLHVKKIIDHAKHMESQKKEGLPFIFWFGIGSLIILFHLFLIRMIFKEYYNNLASSSASNKTYYSNRGRLAS